MRGAVNPSLLVSEQNTVLGLWRTRNVEIPRRRLDYSDDIDKRGYARGCAAGVTFRYLCRLSETSSDTVRRGRRPLLTVAAWLMQAS